MSAKVVEIIRTHLSDGSMIRLSKFKRKYTCMHGPVDPMAPPEITDNLSQKEAYKMFEEALRKDVLESDY